MLLEKLKEESKETEGEVETDNVVATIPEINDDVRAKTPPVIPVSNIQDVLPEYLKSALALPSFPKPSRFIIIYRKKANHSNVSRAICWGVIGDLTPDLIESITIENVSSVTAAIQPIGENKVYFQSSLGTVAYINLEITDSFNSGRADR